MITKKFQSEPKLAKRNKANPNTSIIPQLPQKKSRENNKKPDLWIYLISNQRGVKLKEMN